MHTLVHQFSMTKFMVAYVGCGMFGTAAGVGARAIYWHFMGVSVITEQTLMPIGVMVAVGSTLLLAGWLAGRLVRGFEAKIDEINTRLDDHLKNDTKGKK